MIPLTVGPTPEPGEQLLCVSPTGRTVLLCGGSQRPILRSGEGGGVALWKALPAPFLVPDKVFGLHTLPARGAAVRAG